MTFACMGLQDTHDVVTSGIGALASSSPAIKAGWDFFGKNDDQRADNMAIAVDCIHNTTLALNQALDGDELVVRDCFADFNCTVSSARSDKQNASLLVCGARGVGKTSIVEAALQVKLQSFSISAREMRTWVA